MITDREMTFSNNQAVTTGTQLSTNAYDTGVVNGSNINTGRGLEVLALVTTAFTGGTSLQVNVVESANSDLSSATVIHTGLVVVEASLTVGTRLVQKVLGPTSKRYLGLQFVTVGTHGAGAIWGGIVRDVDDTAFPAYVTGY